MMAAQVDTSFGPITTYNILFSLERQSPVDKNDLELLFNYLL